MKLSTLKSTIAVTLLTSSVSFGTTLADEIRLQEIQSDREFESQMPVTGTVETYFGDFELDHSFPSEETADRIYELIDHQRASAPVE